jgi:hypothetical protein
LSAITTPTNWPHGGGEPPTIFTNWNSSGTVKVKTSEIISSWKTILEGLGLPSTWSYVVG